MHVEFQMPVTEMMNCVFRLLEHNIIWEEALLQTVHQALQWGRALGMRHPKDHWHKGTSRNTNTAPYSRYWGGFHRTQDLSLTSFPLQRSQHFSRGWCFKFLLKLKACFVLLFFKIIIYFLIEFLQFWIVWLFNSYLKLISCIMKYFYMRQMYL